MLLIDILSLINENSNVTIWSDEEIASYNSKDSIPEELNNREVVKITAGFYKLDIDLKD